MRTHFQERTSQRMANETTTLSRLPNERDKYEYEYEYRYEYRYELQHVYIFIRKSIYFFVVKRYINSAVIKVKNKIKNKKQMNDIPIGLANLGNTCYLNSCVQVIRKIPEFEEITQKYAKSININNTSVSGNVDAELLYVWASMQNAISEIRKNCENPETTNGSTIIINPTIFVKTVYYVASKKNREIFSGWAQNDMSEFLIFLLDSVHEAIKRPVQIKIKGTPVFDVDNLAIQCYSYIKDTYSKEYSEIFDVFYGISVTQISDPISHKLWSSKPEHYFIVDLPIANCNTIYDCFDALCAGELLTGENAWFNETKNAKEPGAIKSTVFWNFPKILVITLNRFSKGSRKNGALVNFPIENLNLEKYVKGYKPESYVYDLFGVCNHYGGGIGGGHYTAFSRNWVQGNRDQENRDQENWTKWLEHNDASVREIDAVVTPAAYCLFYRKRQ